MANKLEGGFSYLPESGGRQFEQPGVVPEPGSTKSRYSTGGKKVGPQLGVLIQKLGGNSQGAIEHAPKLNVSGQSKPQPPTSPKPQAQAAKPKPPTSPNPRAQAAKPKPPPGPPPNLEIKIKELIDSIEWEDHFMWFSDEDHRPKDDPDRIQKEITETESDLSRLNNITVSSGNLTHSEGIRNQTIAAKTKLEKLEHLQKLVKLRAKKH